MAAILTSRFVVNFVRITSLLFKSFALNWRILKYVLKDVLKILLGCSKIDWLVKKSFYFVVAWFLLCCCLVCEGASVLPHQVYLLQRKLRCHFVVVCSSVHFKCTQPPLWQQTADCLLMNCLLQT